MKQLKAVHLQQYENEVVKDKIVNIIVVCDYKIHPKRVGGMDRFFKLFDLRVKALGYTITWFFSNIEHHEFYDDLKVISANNRGVLQYTEEYLFVSNEKVDVLITHFVTQYSTHFKNFKEKHHIKKVICVDHNPRPINGFSLKKRIKKRIKGFLFHKYIDKIIGVSKYTSAHSIKDFGGLTAKNTQTIYNGIDASVFKNKKQLNKVNEVINFIVVSHLRHSKGIQDLLKALSNLSESEKQHIKLDIFGSGPYEEELKKLSNEYNLKNIVFFKGSSPELHLSLYKYDYMLQPTYMECFSLSILESLLSNVPVITTTVGGNPEVIINGQNGWLFEAKDVDRLTSIIKNIVSGKFVIQNDVFEEIEEKYTIEIMVENHIKLLKN